MKVNAILLKPLDGEPEGGEREFDRADFNMLAELGALREVAAEPSPSAAVPEPHPVPGVYEKAAEAPENKMRQPVENKAAPERRRAR